MLITRVVHERQSLSMLAVGRFGRHYRVDPPSTTPAVIW
jgi:hypothetical protein